MIDVTVQPFGRSLMAMYLGVLKYQATALQNANATLKKELEHISRLKSDEEMATNISIELTSKLIDRRFKTSKAFIESNGMTSNNLRYKKSTTQEDRDLEKLAERQRMQYQMRLNRSVSNYNKRLETMKANSIYRKLNFSTIEK